VAKSSRSTAPSEAVAAMLAHFQEKDAIPGPRCQIFFQARRTANAQPIKGLARASSSRTGVKYGPPFHVIKDLGSPDARPRRGQHQSGPGYGTQDVTGAGPPETEPQGIS